MQNRTTFGLRFLLATLLTSALTVPPLLAMADAPPAAPIKAALAVTAVQPSKAVWDTQIAASGSVTAWQEAVIASEISGQRIDKLLVDVGDNVARGQTLALLAQDAVQADLAQAEAKVTQAEASVAQSHTDAERARRLKVTGALPAQQIDQYLTTEASDKANLAAQQAALQAQQIRLKQTRIVAADDGVISSRSATLGSVVQAGTELFRLVRQNKLEWQAEIAGHDFALIKPGQKARMTLPTGEIVEGKVRILSPTLNANTRNAIAYISLPVGSPARAGMFAQGTVSSGSSSVTTLPEAAVIVRDGNNYLFEIKADNKVSQRQVQVGQRKGGRVAITSDLAADANIVATGGAFLNDGDTVQVISAPAAPTTPTNAAGAKP